MAHFEKPPGGNSEGYDADNKLAPGSLWRVRIPLRSARNVALWSGVGLKVTSNNPNVVPNEANGRLKELAPSGELRVFELFGASEGGSWIDVWGADGAFWFHLQALVASGSDSTLATGSDATLATPREAPPLITQGDQRLCWAAALQSWLMATVRDYGEEEGIWSGEIAKKHGFDGLPWKRKVYGLQDMMTLWGDQAHKDKSQTPDGIRIIALDVGMDGDLIMPTSLTPGYMSEKLRQKRYIYMLYFSRSSYHAIVVYGISNNALQIMDPLPTQGLTKREFKFFREPQRADKKILVLWAVRGTRAAPSSVQPSGPSAAPSSVQPSGPSAAQRLYYQTVLVPLWRGQLDELGRLARDYRSHLLALECLRRAKGPGVDSVKVAEFCRTWKIPLSWPLISPTALLKALAAKFISGWARVFDIFGAVSKGVQIMAELGPLLERLQMKQALLIAFDEKVVPTEDQAEVGGILESSGMPKTLFAKGEQAKDRLQAKWKEIISQAEKMEAMRKELGLPEEKGSE